MREGDELKRKKERKWGRGTNWKGKKTENKGGGWTEKEKRQKIREGDEDDKGTRMGGGYVGGGKKKGKKKLKKKGGGGRGEGKNIQREQRVSKEENEKGRYFGVVKKINKKKYIKK